MLNRLGASEYLNKHNTTISCLLSPSLYLLPLKHRLPHEVREVLLVGGSGGLQVVTRVTLVEGQGGGLEPLLETEGLELHVECFSC